MGIESKIIKEETFDLGTGHFKIDIKIENLLIHTTISYYLGNQQKYIELEKTYDNPFLKYEQTRTKYQQQQEAIKRIYQQ